MAIPMKRQMINVEQLRFPSGIAAAETLRALHSVGGAAARSARALGLAGLIALVSKFWADGLVIVNAKLAPFMISTWTSAFNERVLGPAWMGRTVMLSWEPMFFAAGAITGLRVSWSMLLGGVSAWMVFVPLLQHRGVIQGSGYATLVQWTLWGGVACMVASSLLSFALQWRTAARAFTDLGRMFGRRRATADPLAAIETPASWFVAGQLVGFVGLAWIGHAVFGMPYWQTAVAVLLSFALALVACRVTGETDTTPVGAMGKITQLAFGVLSPGNMNVNLMSANITAATAGSSADLLTDLKSGYLLGANPRQQFLAQFAGIFVGAIVTVLSFRILVPDASVLGSDLFPAPAAQTWRAVAIALSGGLAALGAVKIWSIVVGALVGVALTVLPLLMPERHHHLIPSPAGVGLAWTFHWHYGVLFFAGALLGWGLEKRHRQLSEELTFPVASGWIAGESLMGVALVMWENAPALLARLLGR
jgi:uncharacterized oligopeptide transporter (OPT) family protein